MTKANASRTTRYTGHAAGKYRVTSENCELPRGSRFAVLPASVRSGQLILFLLRGVPQIGRYFSNVAGYDWILQTDRAIKITDGRNTEILGPIVSLETEVKQITNLPESEYGRFFENPFPSDC